MKLAYGSIKKIQDAINLGTIKPGTLIITSDEDGTGELFFYDNEKKLKKIEQKTKFTSYTDAVDENTSLLQVCFFITSNK